MTPIVAATGLRKSFGDQHALVGLDLEVEEGTVLGLLGPNGAGKTTAVRIFTTLLDPDGGTATVAGIDVVEDPVAVRRNIGLSGQYAAVDEILTGFENLDMVGRLYRLGRTRSRERARELLERFGLADAGDRPVKGYSGGMRRRLDLAAALVAAPPVLFLDEPSTGLDPQSRNELWQVIRELVADGATLLLTTQYLEEADQLADEIVVIDHGQAIAQGTADQLKRQLGGERIEVVLADPTQMEVAAAAFAGPEVGEVNAERHARSLTAPVADGNGSAALRAVLGRIDGAGVEFHEFGLRRPTLDDVFLTLTGHRADHGGEDGEAAPAGASSNGTGAVTRSDDTKEGALS